MEFGDFTTLSTDDQAIVNKILFSAETSCKEGKRPEFSWIDTPDAVDSETDCTRGIGFEFVDFTNKDILMAGERQIPAPVGVVQHMLPPYGYPLAFAPPPPFMNYAPGIPMDISGPDANVPMISAPLRVVYAYPQHTIPSNTDLNYMHTNAQMHAPAEQITSTTNSETNTHLMEQRETNVSPVSDSGKKIVPRRNKKRRPPGYYQDLDARQQQAQPNIDSVESSLANVVIDGAQQAPAADIQANVVTDSFVPDSIVPTGSCSSELSQVIRVNSNIVETQKNTQYIAETLQPVFGKQLESESVQTVSKADSCDSSHIELHQHVSRSNSDANVVNQSVVKSYQSGNTQLPFSFEYENVHETNGERVTDTVSVDSELSKQQVQENIHNIVESNSVVDTTEPCTIVSNDVTPVANDLTSPANTVSHVENDSEQTETSQQTHTEPPVPKKPTSWAGLFSSTKQAQAATVIYSAYTKKVNVETGSGKSSGGKETKLTVVPVSNDKAATLIAGKIDAYRLNHKPLALVPRGLTNKKTWCYVNATLQALLACPPFYHLMKTLPTFAENSRGPSSSPFTDALVKFANEFQSMHERPPEKVWLNTKGTMKLDIPQGKTFEPTYVYDVLRLPKYAAHFISGRQEDAEEFLSCVLNGMHEEMVAALALIHPPPAETEPESNGDVATENSNPAVIDEDGWEQVGPKNKAVITRSTGYSISPISRVFQGQIRSILHQIGTRESATLQPFFTLQLDIQSDKVWSVKDALEHLVKKENLQDYTCTKTKQEIEASRRIVLEELPSVLILHLKYFVYDKSGGSQKLTKHIDFSEHLELSKDFLSPNIKSKVSSSHRKYKLFAVVNHHGARLLGGHYTTYAFHCGINGWIHIDDEIVRTVKVESMLKHNPPKVPYLLYYRRVESQQ